MIKARGGFLFLVAVAAVPVQAGVIWQWTHEASFGGTANVFDGGPPVTRSFQTDGPDDPNLLGSARDFTIQPGVLGALASASGSSFILEEYGTLRIMTDLSVGYTPSGFPGGDNPGGEAEGHLTSVVDVVMPVDDVMLRISSMINEVHPDLFSGDARMIVENLTQGSIVFDLSEQEVTGFFDLANEAGDVIRVSTVMSGQGSMGPGTGRRYRADLDAVFSVPEPSSVLLLSLGILVFSGRRRRSAMRLIGSKPAPATT